MFRKYFNRRKLRGLKYQDQISWRNESREVINFTVYEVNDEKIRGMVSRSNESGDILCSETVEELSRVPQLRVSRVKNLNKKINAAFK